jgi:hypothetical protein
MKHLLVGIAAAMILAVIDPVRGAGPVGHPQWPPATYPAPYLYRFVAPIDYGHRRAVMRDEFDGCISGRAWHKSEQTSRLSETSPLASNRRSAILNRSIGV